MEWINATTGVLVILLALLAGSIMLRGHVFVYWACAWSAQLTVTVLFLNRDLWLAPAGARFFAALVPTLFLAGALRYANRPWPRVLIPAVFVYAAFRCSLSLAGFPRVVDSLALLCDPTMIVIAAIVVHRSLANDSRRSVQHLIAPTLIGLGVIDGLDALAGLVGRYGDLVDNGWFVVGAAACSVQVISLVDYTRAEKAVATEALNESLRRLDALGAGSHDVITDLDQSGRVLWVSPTVRTVLGYEPEALVGRSFADFSHPEEPDLTDDIRAEIRANGAAIQEPTRYRRADGRWCWIESTLRAYRGGKGETRLLVVARDVSERMEAKASARASEERFRQLTENSSYLVSELDGDGRIVYLSPNHRQLLDEDPAEFLGRPVREFTSQLQLEQGEVRRREASSDPAHADQGLLTRVHFGDGARRYFESRVTAYRDAAGSQHVLTVSRDVTESLEVAHELRASEERLRAILSSLVKTRVILFDTDGAVLKAFGDDSPMSELVEPERALDELFGPESAPKIRELLCAVFETGEVVEARQRADRKDEARYFDTSVSPLRSESGEIEAALAVVRDITDQVRSEAERSALEAEMQQAQKLESLGVLAGGVAHDFNNLMVGIVGNIELALLKLGPDSAARDLLLDAQRASERTSELNRQILAYAGKGKFTIEPIDLSELVSEIAQLLRTSVPKTASLGIDASDHTPTLRGDPTQMRQVVMNLLTNAADALPNQRGHVRLSTGVAHLERADLSSFVLGDGLEPGDYAYVEVEDDGNGIDDETRERMFDPFFTTRPLGRGLGLAAVLGIVRSHRGALRVESEPGRGTRFRVLLPLVESNAGTRARPVSKGSCWRGEGAVLVVDDDASVRRVTLLMLAELGFHGIEAPGGAEAIAHLAKADEPIAAVLLDLTMPEMDGEETFVALRKLRGDLPVVLMSGHSAEEMSQRLSGHARVSRMAKPFRSELLAERLRSVLAS